MAGGAVNESGESADVCVLGVLGPDETQYWPTYSAANGYVGVDVALVLPDAESLS